MKVSLLESSEYIPYFKNYINQVEEEFGLIEGLELGFKSLYSFYESIPEGKHKFSYVEGKWTVKEIISHLIDTERVFCYRAMRFARKDNTPLAGFDENNYAMYSGANKRSMMSLLKEYKVVRQSTIALFKSFDNDMLMSRGVAGGGEVTVRALGFLIIGHEKHHSNVIRERYL